MVALALLLIALAADPSAAPPDGTDSRLTAAGDDRALCPGNPAEESSELGAHEEPSPEPEDDGLSPEHPLVQRLLDYSRLGLKHRISGLASYYSSHFDGRKTANGEIFRNGKHSAAHLTLPLGTWIEVTARATGRSLRMRVNDRGPYARKFVLDLSQAAARHLGVDKTRDRHVEIRILALPGEEPPPEDLDLKLVDAMIQRSLGGGTP